jgi:hypothetical protein
MHSVQMTTNDVMIISRFVVDWKVLLLENAVPGCLNGKRFTAHNSETGTPMNVFRRNENLNLFLKLAAEERCHLINIGANDISSGK